jgi:hypothetical protein
MSAARRPRSRGRGSSGDERLDGIGEMLLIDVVVPASDPDAVGLEQDVGVGVTVRDPALVEALDRLGEGRLREREGEVVHAAGLGRRAVGIDGSVLVGEDRDSIEV